MLFASSKDSLANQTQRLAEEMKARFARLEGIIKKGEYVLEDHRKITEDREQFLKDNGDTQVDQNVNRNTDNKRANWILAGVMLMGTIFSIKSLSFFFENFYAISSNVVIIPIAILMALVLVLGSIRLNHFSEQYRGKNTFIFLNAKAAAYSIVLFLPVMNLLEGFSSNFTGIAMGLNIVAVLVDITAHTALVSMHNTFITAENSKLAIKILRQKETAQRKADAAVRSINDTFLKSKNEFSQKASEFVHSYKLWMQENEEAAAQVMFLIPNFLVWMINNKVMQHAVLPYHANENGQPVVEWGYFTPENDAVRKGWDQLSTVKGYNNGSQPIELPIQEPETLGQVQTQLGVNQAPMHQQEPNQQQPQDYDAMVEETHSNINDKTL